MKSDKPAFKNSRELAEVLDALKKSSPNKRRDQPALKDATSLFDLFENLQQATSKEEFDRLVKHNKLLSNLLDGKEDARRFIHVKTNPLLAAVSDAEGRVQVGDQQIDVLSESGAREMMLLPQPEPDPGTGGTTGSSGTPSYVFSELPPEEWVQGIPCGPWTVLPGYPTHFFDANIGGRVVLVQLWKGTCPDYLGQGPGGVGAEVGIYNRDAWLPGTFWWPDFSHAKSIDYTLLNPVTTRPFFSAGGSTPIWWLHKWMKLPSYDQYRIDQNNQVPAATEQYVLRFHIDGRLFEW